MSEIRFYHLQTQSLEQALPQILSKALTAGHKVLVRGPDVQQVERLNEQLWTYRPDSFLPHGSTAENYAADQPVLLTDGKDNTNNADVLVLTGGVEAGDIDGYKLCCEIFDGRNDDAVATARTHWKAFKDSPHELTYWQQNEKGGWDKKA